LPPLWQGEQQPGCFLNFEVGLVKPHLNNNLVSGVNVIGLGPDTVSLPSGWLGGTVSPRVEFGYRLAEGGPELLVAYRNVTSEGFEGILDFDPQGNGCLHTRLDLNVIDLDYATRQFILVPNLDLQGQVGARFATLYFDEHAVGQILDQKVSNNFVGAGPQLGFNGTYWFPGTRLGLFTRAEGAVLFGEVRQNFAESFWVNDVPVAGGAANQHGAQTVPVFRVQAGLSWSPQWSNHSVRFTGGYEYEYWWNLGSVGPSNADLTIQGLFLRGEWTF